MATVCRSPKRAITLAAVAPPATAPIPCTLTSAPSIAGSIPSPCSITGNTATLTNPLLPNPAAIASVVTAEHRGVPPGAGTRRCNSSRSRHRRRLRAASH